MKIKTFITVLLVSIPVLSFVNAGFVENAGFFITNMPLGREIDFKETLTTSYENTGSYVKDVEFFVEFVSSCEDANERVKIRFENIDKIESIPEISWIVISPLSATVQPHQKVDVHIKVFIPKEKNNFNKVWEFGIGYREKQDQFELEVVSRCYIATVRNNTHNDSVLKSGAFEFTDYEGFIHQIEKESSSNISTGVLILICAGLIMAFFVIGYLLTR